MSRDYRCVGLVERISFHYSYALFGVRVMKRQLLQCLRKESEEANSYHVTVARRYSTCPFFSPVSSLTSSNKPNASCLEPPLPPRMGEKKQENTGSEDGERRRGRGLGLDPCSCVCLSRPKPVDYLLLFLLSPQFHASHRSSWCRCHAWSRSSWRRCHGGGIAARMKGISEVNRWGSMWYLLFG